MCRLACLYGSNAGSSASFGANVNTSTATNCSTSANENEDFKDSVSADVSDAKNVGVTIGGCVHNSTTMEVDPNLSLETSESARFCISVTVRLVQAFL